MSADNTSNTPTQPTGSSTRDSQKEMDPLALSVEQPFGKSSSPSIKPRDSSSLELLDLTAGDPLHIKKVAANALISIAGKTSGAPVSIESAAIIKDFIDTTSRGFVGNMPMKCRGVGCMFISACPLQKAGSKLPVGLPCPVEKTIISLWVGKHLTALGIKDIDNPDHSFDMDLLYELAGQELIRWRCSVHLSDDPSLVSNRQVGATVHGEPIFADVITPVLEVLERAGRNISKIREALVATREAQIKAGQDTKDSSQRAADLRDKANKVVARRERYLSTLKEESIKDADFEVGEL